MLVFGGGTLISSSFSPSSQSSADLDQALEKIFHPERFDVTQLNKDNEANVDVRGRFYAVYDPTKGSGTEDEEQVTMRSRPIETVSEDEAASKSSVPGFFRSVSSDEPVHDDGVKRVLSHHSLQMYMRTMSEHDEHLYPHTHQSMKRIKPKSLKRGEADHAAHAEAKAMKFHKPQKRGSSKLFGTEGISPMPTIPDLETEAGLIKEEHSEVSADEKPTLGEANKSAAFSIAFEEEEDEVGESAKVIFSREMSQGTQESSIKDWASGRKVSFTAGSESEQDMVGGARKRVDSQVSSSHDEDAERTTEDELERKKRRRRRRRKMEQEQAASLTMRRTLGSELQMDDMLNVMPTEEDEARMLAARDVEDLAFHRKENVVPTAHLIKKRTASGASMLQVRGLPSSPSQSRHIQTMVDRIYGEKPKGYDHSPHDLFVEMDELEGDAWVEQARWIKYEEDREVGAERWGKAHISSLSFHSLINLRLCLESGVFILDFEARDLPEVVYRVVEEFSIDGIIEEEQKGEVLRVLLFRHKYVESHDRNLPKLSGIRKNLSHKSLSVSKTISLLIFAHEKYFIDDYAQSSGDIVGGFLPSTITAPAGLSEPFRWLRALSREQEAVESSRQSRQNPRIFRSRCSLDEVDEDVLDAVDELWLERQVCRACVA